MNELELTIPGLTIAYKTWGKPENPPIIALHGWLDNANSFQPLAQCLEDKYYFIAVDLPGHGRSSHLPINTNYHFIDGAFTIIQIINALQLTKVHLLGHSLGACLGSLVAGIAPEYFLSLGLIEGLGPLTRPASTTASQLSAYLHYLTRDKTKSPKGYSSFDLAALARSKHGFVSIDIASILCERGVIEKRGLFYWRHDRRLVAPSPLYMTEDQVLSCLKQIQAKTCLIWASNGFSFHQDLMQERINAVKNLKIERLKGGHHIHMEKPEAIAQLLADFYNQLD